MSRSLFRRAVPVVAAGLGLAFLGYGVVEHFGWFRRPAGLSARPDAAPYLGMPATPEFAYPVQWSTEAAFPNVTFKNPVLLEPEPGTDRLWIGELEGTLAAVSTSDPASWAKQIVLDLTRQTQGGFDSGLLGLAFHPEYGRADSPNRDFVYVFYSWNPQPVMIGRPEPETITWSRVSRFTMNRATGALRPESEQVLIHQRKRIIFHVGGPMFFHPKDGFLYIAVGDEGGQQDSLNNSQRIDHNLFAGVLRIDVDRRGGAISHPIPRQPADGERAHYFIPNDNPFVGRPGALEEFYAIGLRSPHRMTYDAVTDLAWIGEIGQATREEIEVLRFGRAPQNFQWAVREGSRPGFKPMPAEPLGIWTDPVWDYGREMGRSVIGGYVYHGRRHPSLQGKYICGDFANGRIWALGFSAGPDRVKIDRVEHLATGAGFRNYHGGAGGITSFGLDHAGELYVLRHGLKTRIERLFETRPRGGNVPALLSQTGVFRDFARREPAPALLPYDVVVPGWMNGATARRWISVPRGQTIRFDPTGPWTFPAGTVLVQHLDWSDKPGATRPLETRLLVVGANEPYGVTYRWRKDGSDADLVDNDDVSEGLGWQEAGQRGRLLWAFPGSGACTECHTPGAGHVLGVKARQLNRDFTYPGGVVDNQLRAWSAAGLFSAPLSDREIGRLPRLAALEDAGASAELRVRSYLDANCASCHGATAIHAAWNANFNLPLESQGIVHGSVLGHRPDDRHHVVTPGDPARSELYLRVSENIIGRRMPPLGNDRVNAGFARLLEQWIQTLPPGGTPRSGAAPAGSAK